MSSNLFAALDQALAEIESGNEVNVFDSDDPGVKSVLKPSASRKNANPAKKVEPKTEDILELERDLENVQLQFQSTVQPARKIDAQDDDEDDDEFPDIDEIVAASREMGIEKGQGNVEEKKEAAAAANSSDDENREEPLSKKYHGEIDDDDIGFSTSPEDRNKLSFDLKREIEESNDETSNNQQKSKDEEKGYSSSSSSDDTENETQQKIEREKNLALIKAIVSEALVDTAALAANQSKNQAKKVEKKEVKEEPPPSFSPIISKEMAKNTEAINEDEEDDGEEKGGGVKDVEQPSRPAPTKSAAEEWAEIEEINARNPLPDRRVGVQEAPVFLVSFTEAMEFFDKSINRDVVRKQIVMTATYSGCWKAFLRKIKRPPHLLPNLVDEAELVFCIGKTAFDNDAPFHLRILQTIYARLNNETRPCPRMGKHWEQIGFQQSDPVTDLRDLGMLSLVQLLAFVTSRFAADARTILLLSNHSEQHFPFAAVAVNLSRVCLHSLRLGALIPSCNLANSVIKTLNDFYIGAFFEFYRQWRTKNATIQQGSFHEILSSIEDKAYNSPDLIMRSFRQGLYQGPSSLSAEQQK